MSADVINLAAYRRDRGAEDPDDTFGAIQAGVNFSVTQLAHRIEACVALEMGDGYDMAVAGNEIFQLTPGRQGVDDFIASGQAIAKMVEHKTEGIGTYLGQRLYGAYYAAKIGLEHIITVDKNSETAMLHSQLVQKQLKRSAISEATSERLITDHFAAYIATVSISPTHYPDLRNAAVAYAAKGKFADARPAISRAFKAPLRRELVAELLKGKQAIK